MAITVVSSGGFTPATANGVATFTVPTVINNDLTVIFSTSASSGADVSTITGLTTTPTAVSTKASVSGQESVPYQGLLVSGDTGATVIVTLTNATIRHSMVWFVLRGINTSAPIDSFSSKTQTTASAVPTTPALTTVGDGCIELGLMAMANSTTAIASLTPPGGFTSAGTSLPTTAAGSMAAAGAYDSLAGSAAGSSFGTRTFTSDQSKPYNAWTLAIAPAPAAAWVYTYTTTVG